MAENPVARYTPQVTGAYQNALQPQAEGVLQQRLGGGLSDAQQQYLAQQQEQSLQTMRESYGARGAPTGAAQSAERRMLTDTNMQAALMSGQQQTQALNQIPGYLNYGAQQYWAPEQMAQSRYGLDLQQGQLGINQQQMDYNTQQDPWYLQALGAAGGLVGDIVTPAAQAYLGGPAAAVAGQSFGVGADPYARRA